MRVRAHWIRGSSYATAALVCLALLAACASGPVRRVSEPSARIQQLTVQADGSWSVDLRIENFSSIPMRFESVDLALEFDGGPVATLQLQPALTIGPESADVVDLTVTPDLAGKLAIADALAAGRSVTYSLEGSIGARPEESRLRNFDIERRSALSPTPGLPGVLR
ncbi:LEA type 2 family protein [Lysobacter sp. D1-1-M9]|uniref:LEA type 2 family protein n=1 Tax=Novilysobacter longmucuonensis TaxID=3098603 RepID=UPI002FC92866